MGQGNHAFDVMQSDRDFQVVPESSVPRRKLGMHRTEWTTRHHEMAVVVTQLLAIYTGEQAHVLPA